MRTNIVLIDFENTQPASLTQLVEDRFRVIVFVGAAQARLPFEFVAAMQRLGDQAEYIKIASAGPNALDFHIAYYIGQLAAQDSSVCFHIISKDAGFDPLIEHLKTKKICVTRSSSLESLLRLKTEIKKSTQERVELFIAKLQNPEAPRPKSELSLTRSLASYFGNKVSEHELSAVVKMMQSRGIITIINGKIAYPTADKSPSNLSKA